MSFQVNWVVLLVLAGVIHVSSHHNWDLWHIWVLGGLFPSLEGLSWASWDSVPCLIPSRLARACSCGKGRGVKEWVEMCKCFLKLLLSNNPTGKASHLVEPRNQRWDRAPCPEWESTKVTGQRQTHKKGVKNWCSEPSAVFSLVSFVT